MSRTPAHERLWPKLVAGPDGCWIYTGYRNRQGYGWIDGYTAAGKSRPFHAHRVAWEFFFGPIPDGLHLDHLCHNRDESCPGGPTCRHRPCVNPWHMDVVTPAVNAQRGNSPTALNGRKTHCHRGHEFDESNTRMHRGGRECRTCHRERERERRWAS